MADFRYYINRTGPRGPQGLQGEKGDPGNTFTVSEGVNTPTEYTLIFDGGDGNQFETDNLRNPIVDRGGTYVRYDRDNVTQYIGEPDMAVIDGTPGIVNLAGKDTENPNASDAVAYELLEKTVDELNTALENLDGAVDGLDRRLDTAEGTLEQAQGDISQAQLDIVSLDNRVTTNEGNITSLQSGKADKSTTYTKTEVDNALAGKANTVHTHTISQITNAGALASQNTVDYQTQVTNKPTIPTVGNGTITLTQGGVTKGTFTTNQSGNSTIDLDAGGGSQLTAGNAINISDNVISVKYDGTTIGLNASGQLQSLVEEPDMTNYYTKQQVDNLIPDISGKADSSDVGEMFQAARTVTEKQNNCLFTDYTYGSTSYTYATGISGPITESMMQGTYITLNFEVDEPYYDSSNNTLTYYNKDASVIKPIYAEDILTGYILTPKSQEISYGYMTIGGVPMKVNNLFGMPSLQYLVTNGVQDNDNYVTTPKSVTGSPDVTSAQYFVETFRDIERTYISESDDEAYITINNTSDVYMQSILTYCNVYRIKTRMNSGIQEVCFLQATNYSYNSSTQVGKLLFSGYGVQGTNGTAALGKLGSLDSTVHQYLIASDTSYSGKLEITDAANCYFSDIDNIINPTTTTTVTPNYKWENDRFAQYTDYASTQTAGLVKVGNNLSIAADGTLSADTQAPTAGTGITVSGTAVSVNVDSSTITINGSGQLVANLPGAATSSTLGLVKPDNTTIVVDANGEISANIPTPATVDQTYDATSVNAQSGVAIAGAGFINGSIVQSPLEYLPDTTDSLTYQNVNTSTMSGSSRGIGTYGQNNSNPNYNAYVDNSTWYDLRSYPEAINLENFCWFETELTNGLNIGFKGNSNTANSYVYALGHYDDHSVFKLDALIQAGYTGCTITVIDGNNPSQTYLFSGGYGTDTGYSVGGCSLDNTTLKIRTNNYSANTTISSSAKEILNQVTHIRVFKGDYGNVTLSLSNIKVINPTLGQNDCGYTMNTTVFDNYANIFDAHSESLSLKYDSATLGVNASGQLYAISSTPSNMVTTDTQQIITGRKDMAIINIQPSGSTGYLNYITPISSGRIAISKSTSYDTAGTQPGILLEYSGGSSITSVGYGGSGSYINLCTQYGNNTTELRFCNGYKAGQVGSGHAGIGKYGDYTYIRNNNTNDKKIYKITTGGTSSSDFTNFLVEKDMLDGTTISYDNTTGKISAAAQQQGVLPVSDDVTEIYTTNYTIIGNPIITSDHVFSTTDGADSLTSTVPFRDASEAVSHSIKFECQFRPTAASHSNGEGIFCRDSNSDGVRISLNSSACVRFRTSINGTGVLDVAFSNTPLVQNTLYKLTAEIAAGASSGTGTLYTSSDNGTTWTTAETITLGTNTPLAIGADKTSLHYFGVNTPGPTLPFGGEILLDKMYLEEDDVVIWSPITSTGDITEIGEATTSEYGLVKIDGTTIKTDADGKLGVINYLTLPDYADTTNTFDYSSMGTTSQTIPFDGWFVCASNPVSNGTRELLINGVVVNGGTRMSGVVPDVSGCYPVRKGDTVQFSGISNATNTYWFAKLIPFRSI